MTDTENASGSELGPGGIVDIHTHILPGIDDGADSLETSLAMAAGAVACGVSIVVATPHAYDDASSDEFVARAAAAHRQVMENLERNSIPLTVELACEAHISLNLLDRIDRGTVLTIGRSRRHLLLEFPNGQLPRFSGNMVFELLMAGIVPIIAHPERNLVFQTDPGRLETMVQQGALTQLTAASLCFDRSHPFRSAAETYLEHNWVHAVASDMHRPPSGDFRLDSAESELADIVGKENASDLLRRYPAAIVAGTSVPSIPEPYRPQPQRVPGILARLLPRRKKT